MHTAAQVNQSNQRLRGEGSGTCLRCYSSCCYGTGSGSGSGGSKIIRHGRLRLRWHGEDPICRAHIAVQDIAGVQLL